MKKLKLSALLIAAAAMLAACSASSGSGSTAEESTVAAETTAEEKTDTADTAKEEDVDTSDSGPGVRTLVRVGSLKGPTSIGLVHLMDQADRGLTKNNYEFTMMVQPDEVSAAIAGGTIDIGLLPANVASILYYRTDGGITVIDINTLGVLDVVTADSSITSFDDLRGKTIYTTGKGATPDYTIRYLLEANGISEDEVDLEFRSESTEVAALLVEDPDAIAVLPQPFVTSAIAQNPDLKIVLDLTEEWDKVQGEGGSRLISGVTVVRNEFLEENPEAVYEFLDDHLESAMYTEDDPDETAELVAAAGIIEDPETAKAALPYCNIAFITGMDMKDALSGYLGVLCDQDPSSVGGELPPDEFYLNEFALYD